MLVMRDQIMRWLGMCWLSHRAPGRRLAWETGRRATAAVINGHLDSVHRLFQTGHCAIDKPTCRLGKTALFIAAELGNVHAATMLGGAVRARGRRDGTQIRLRRAQRAAKRRRRRPERRRQCGSHAVSKMR